MSSQICSGKRTNVNSLWNSQIFVKWYDCKRQNFKEKVPVLRLAIKLKSWFCRAAGRLSCAAAGGRLHVVGFKTASCFCAPGRAGTGVGATRLDAAREPPVPCAVPDTPIRGAAGAAREARLPWGWRDLAMSPFTPQERWQCVKPGDAEIRIHLSAWGPCSGESLGDRNPDVRLICDLGALIPNSVGWDLPGRWDGSVPHWLLGTSLPNAMVVTWPGGLSHCPGTCQGKRHTW